MAEPLHRSVRSTLNWLCILVLVSWTVLLLALAGRHYYQHQGIARAMAQIIANETYGPAGDSIVVSLPWQPIEAVLWSHAKTDFVQYGGIWLLGVIGLFLVRSIAARRQKEQDSIQRKLAESNRKITSILESITDAFVSLDDNLVIHYCNSAAEVALGKSRGVLLGKRFFEALPAFQGGVFEECLLRAQREKAARSFESQVADGPNANWYSVNVYPHDKGIAIYLGIITERKRAEAALRENEAMLSLILDTSPAATAMTVNRIVKWANDAWVKMFGFQDKSEPIGLDSRTLYPDQQNAERVGSLYHQLSDGRMAHTEAVMKRRDGSVFEAAIYFKPVDPGDLSRGVISAILDISAGREAERQVVFAEQKLERALNGAELGLWIFDVEANLTERNERYAEMLGYSPQEIGATRDGWEKLVHPEDIDRVLKAFDRHVGGELPLFESEYRMKTKGGAWKWVLDRGKIIERDAEDKPLRIAGTIMDISYRKKLEQERTEMQSKVLQAQKLESLSVMAGGIAHQFNNLLQIILGNLELLQRDMPESTRAGGFIYSAFKAARRAAKLSGLMLDYTGQTLYMSRDLDVNDIVSRTEQLLSSVVSRTVRFGIDRGEVLHAVSGDAAQIEQAILSLATNASEAVGDGPGEVRIITGEMDCDEAYLATTRQELHPVPGRYVFFEVSDTGHGMDAGALERIFDPFYTTKFMGRGMGMPALLGIVRGHKGGIRIDSEPGRGATVRVLLPAGAELKAKDEPVAAEQGQAFSAETTSEPRCRVLMVDDDEPVLHLGADLLAVLGHDAVTAMDGELAVRLCSEPGNAIGCVILDLSMPKMDGLQTLRELKRIRPDLKIIISSGYGEPEARLIVGDVDVAGFLTKPYDLDAFKAVLERAQKYP